MTESIEPVAPAAALVVEEDVPCRKCAYNLRGLSHAGQCPECGTAVERSIGGHLIRFSDPQWVAGLSKGVRLILWSIVVTIAAVVLIFILQTGRASGTSLLYESIVFLAASLGYWGSWLLTEPDPSGLGEAEYGRARRIVRVTLMMALITTLLGFGQRMAALPPAVAMVLTMLSVIGSAASVVGYIAQLHYLQHLALRIPEPKLSKRAGSIKKGIGWTYGIIVVVGAVISAATVAIPGAGRGFGLIESLGCVAAIAGVLLLIYGLRYVGLLSKLNKALKTQLAEAQKLWRATTADGV